MNNLQSRIIEVLREGIREANRGNPFITRSDAFSAWNKI